MESDVSNDILKAGMVAVVLDVMLGWIAILAKCRSFNSTRSC